MEDVNTLMNIVGISLFLESVQIVTDYISSILIRNVKSKINTVMLIVEEDVLSVNNSHIFIEEFVIQMLKDV